MAPAIFGGVHSSTSGWQTVIPTVAAETSDEILVRAAQSGDRNAFGHLYQRYSRLVHGILLSRVPHAAVDDLVQDVFLHLLPRLPALRDATRFGAWLAATARNMAIDFHRRAKPVQPLMEDSAAEQAHERAGHDMPPEHRLALLDAIRTLPEAYREPLILRFVEGMTGPEIAERLGLKHGSVRVNLHRGMQMLREKWQPRRPGEDSETRS